MAIKTELPNGPGAAFWGGLRVLAFFGLILMVGPAQYTAIALRRDRYTLPRLFHWALTHVLGLRLRVHGHVAKKPVLIVANHSSYLDIPVLGALIHGAFVAKSEVNSWPLFGRMARLQNTVFIERKTARAGTHRGALRERLEAGETLIVFPEGTSSDGLRTLPFKSTLFSVVEEDLISGPVRVQPVSVACSEVGGLPMGRDWRLYYAWIGDMTLGKHLWDVFKIGHFTVDVVFHEPVTMKEFGDRKALSAHCQRVVAQGVEGILTGRLQKALAV